MRFAAKYGVFSCVLLFMPFVAEAAKIVVFTMQMSGHLSEFGGIGAALVKRGHEVHIVLDKFTKKPPQILESGMKLLEYVSPNKSFVDSVSYERRMMEVFFSRPNNVIDEVVKPRVDYDCQNTLYNKELIDRILSMKFDFALTDGLYFCYALIPYKYNIPFAAVGTPTYSFLTRMHPLLAANPCQVFENNTFFKRLQMFITSLVFEYLPGWFLTESKYMNYAPEKPYKSLWEVQRKASLFILNQNHLVDCPRPAMPNVIYAGGLNTRPAKSLPSKFDTFITEAKNGVVVMSFGSMLSEMPDKYAKIFIDAFSKIKQRVIWRYIPTGEIKESMIPENIMVSKWLPQNDLLAHSNTKLFITHCGNNGQTEAIFHGVPMLGIPLEGDQPYNAFRIVTKGYGLKLDLHTLKVEEVVDFINELIENPKYEAAVDKASRIFKSQQHPADYAAYWIEHVIMFGSDHLKTAANDMSSFQFIMFDIFAFLTFAGVVVVSLLCCCSLAIFRKLFGGRVKSKKD